MRSSMFLPFVTFEMGIHKGKNVIWCSFPYEVHNLKTFKSALPSAKWSSSKKCWHVPDIKALRELIGIAHDYDKLLSNKKIHKVNQVALEKMLAQLQLMSYSENTIKTYLNEFSQLLYELKGVCVDNLSPEKIKSYLLYCITKQNISANHLQSRLNAIKFYFEQVLHKEKFFFDIPRPKKESKLPKVIGVKDIEKLLSVLDNLKHSLMLQLCYGMGLRVSEIINLKITDIDSKRMQVLIESGKGKKDRMVNLPETVLTPLRQYYKEYKPKIFLFEGQYGGKYTTRSVQIVFKKAMQKAKINKKVGVHGLRHSYATHLLEYGTDISFIQKLLGHKDIKTTLIYANINKEQLGNIQSPLDRIKKK